ncbi:hypothetical protein C5N14_26270 [Micromonospora sp. MW-13]|nr:hypothetical protein C5N14_26270 [Micromonospora sp. MW-13]
MRIGNPLSRTPTVPEMVYGFSDTLSQPLPPSTNG